jgi:hypothetical protein
MGFKLSTPDLKARILFSPITGYPNLRSFYILEKVYHRSTRM